MEVKIFSDVLAGRPAGGPVSGHGPTRYPAMMLGPSVLGAIFSPIGQPFWPTLLANPLVDDERPARRRGGVWGGFAPPVKKFPSALRSTPNIFLTAI